MRLHDRQTIRIFNWDYRSPGYYFVTICSNERWQNPFGFIKNQYICLSEIGTITNQYWLNISKHFSHVVLHDYVVMPDHLHGIIQITNSVGTCHGMSLQMGQNRYNKFGKPLSGSLGIIVNQFKSSVTRWCRKQNYGFTWQPNYYERIIRTPKQLGSIRKYIVENPKNWTNH